MKRIIYACLQQTNRFDSEEDFEQYRAALDGKNTPYRVLNIKKDDDGTVVVEMKLQYNTYSVGDYLN